MNDHAEQYVRFLADTVARLVEVQAQAVQATATVFADAIEAAGRVHVYDTGHMVGHELVARTGGFLAFTRLEFAAHTTAGGLGRPEPPSPSDPGEATAALVGWLFTQNTIRPGDALLVSSVSGVSAQVVELALTARERGVPVVALTSVEFSSRLPAKHRRGRRLFEVADVVLDNLAPYGDATQQLPGLAEPVCPLSGVTGAALLWAIVAQTASVLVDRGVKPSVYPSINLPDGPARVAAIENHYLSTGQ